MDLSSLTHVTNFKLTRDAGYSATGRLAFGDPLKMTAPPVIADATASLQAGAACKVDATVDAAIPYTVTITNTTAGFASGPAFSLVAFAQGRPPRSGGSLLCRAGLSFT